MDWWLLTFFLGAILSLFLQEVPAISTLFLLLFIAIGFSCHKNLRSSSGVFLGALWILAQAYLYQNLLPSPLITLMETKQAFVIEGEVLSNQVKALNIPPANLKIHSAKDKANATSRFNFRVDKLNHQRLESPIAIRLSWKNPTIDLAQGQILSLTVKLKPAHGLANIGTFNYLSWLKAHHIAATGYVVNPRNNKDQHHHTKEVKDADSINKNILLIQDITLRQKLFDHYQSFTPIHKLTPILLALAFGERSSLSPELWQVLQATGTSHLIAISGLHVGLLAGSAFYIVMLFFHYIPLKSSSWQRINLRYIAIVVSLLLATLYAYLAGFSLPTQRALVMLNLYWFSRLLAIKLSAKRLMLVTIFILLIISPFSLLTASFWLSFYAVAIIFLSLWRFKYWLGRGTVIWRFIKGLLLIQVALTVMLMPITALFFQQISLVSLFANIIAVPWMSVISIPAALISVLLTLLSEQLAQWFMMLSLQSLTLLWYYLELLSELPYAIISVSLTQELLVLVMGIVALIMCYFSPFLWNKVIKQSAFVLLALAVSVNLLSFIFVNEQVQNNNLLSNNSEKFPKITAKYQAEYGFTPWNIIFFDVGQGTSVLVKRDNHAILYDTGAAYPSGFNMSESVILPFLQYSAIEHLDKVIISHSDNDHAGGIKKLSDNIPIGKIMSNDKKLFTSIKPASFDTSSNTTNAVHDHSSLIDCKPSNSFSWQGLTFEILWPLAGEFSGKSANSGKQKNDDSCVILISDQDGTSMLLTGDISSKVEQKLMSIYPQLRADILQVPHHGSKTSSSQAFLSQLSPNIALVSAGYLNRWNMPVPIVRQRYHDSHIPLLNSAELGQIIITIDDKGINTKSYVNDLRPFWFSH
jgi:competence protein ComEC